MGSKTRTVVVKINRREADLGGTRLGPRMGVGVFGLLRIPLLLGSALPFQQVSDFFKTHYLYNLKYGTGYLSLQQISR